MPFRLPAARLAVASLLAGSLTPLAGSAQGVAPTQRPIVNKVTATWCSPCGGWGWDLFEGLVDTLDARAVPLALHYSGDLANPAAAFIADQLDATGQPQFFIGDERQSATASTRAAARDSIAARVARRADAPATVGVTLERRTSADSVHAALEFFADAQGSFRVAVYAVEDGIVNRQASRGPDAVHERVLRGSVGGPPSGAAVASPLAAAGLRRAVAFALDLDPSWERDRLSLVAVVWRADDADPARLRFVNAFELADWQAVSSVAETVEDSYATRSYRVGGTARTTITAAAGAAAETLSVRLLDASGRLLARRSVHLVGGASATVDWPDVAPGAYVVAVEGARGVVGARVVW